MLQEQRAAAARAEMQARVGEICMARSVLVSEGLVMMPAPPPEADEEKAKPKAPNAADGRRSVLEKMMMMSEPEAARLAARSPHGRFLRGRNVRIRRPRRQMVAEDDDFADDFLDASAAPSPQAQYPAQGERKGKGRGSEAKAPCWHSNIRLTRGESINY